MKFHFATGNNGKIAEFSRLFAEAGIKAEIFSAAETGGMPEVEETAKTFAGNALLKAKALQKQAGFDDWILADDSGLEVENLQNRPGIYSARYAGPDATDAENRQKLLEELKNISRPGRSARFICVLALVGPKNIEETFEGICRGEISKIEQGNRGFGYDPIFMPEGFEKTFGELPASIKDDLSHRGAAFKKLFEWLKRKSGQNIQA